MKKFIFSAIAMVAFSGSSMANTIDFKEEIKTETLDTGGPSRSDSLDGFVGCLAASNAVRETAQDLGITNETHVDALANAAFDACVATIKK